MYVWVCAQVCKYSLKTEGGIGSSGARVTGSHELPNMGAGNPTEVLFQDSTCHALSY